MFNQLSGQFRTLYAEIMKSGRKRLEFDLPEGSVANRVTVTCQNRKSLIFILHFNDNQTYLTLEVDQEIKLYGLPPKLAVDDFDLVHPLFRDVLGPVLADVMVKHVPPEPIRLLDYVDRRPAFMNPEPSAEISHSEPIRVEQVSKKEKSRLRLLTPILEVLSGPEPPAVEQTPKRERVVIYSRTQLEDLLPRNTTEETINRLIKVIRGVEAGTVQFVDKIDELGQDAWEVRIKKHRLLFRHHRGNLYTLVGAGPRGDDRRVFRIS